MRSQVFGFYIPTKTFYELLIPAPMPHVCSILVQHTRACNGLPHRLERQYTVISTPPYTQGLDIFMNEWDEETVMIVHGVVRKYGLGDEGMRMQTLQRELSWRWPRFRETAVAVQFLMSSTVDNETNMSIATGWNSAADIVDTTLAERFIQTSLGMLEKNGLLPATILTGGNAFNPAKPVKPTEPIEPAKPYGIRRDTVGKIANLRKTRRQSIKRGQVMLQWTRGCQMEGITPSIVKKYDPELHTRWYDSAYC